MQLRTRDFNSMRAAVGRRRGVGSVVATARAIGWGAYRDVPVTDAQWEVSPPIVEQAAPERWRPIKPHRATRNIGLRSKRALRVSLPDERGQEIRLESLIETWLVLTLLAMSDVVDVIEQPKLVWYVGDDGKWHKHWFDCIAVFADGRRRAYVVKPKALAEYMGTRRLVELLAMQVEPHVADTVMHVDEDCLSPDDYYNAELINVVRLHGPFRDAAAVRAMEAVVRGPMLLDEAVSLAGHGGLGYRAIARLIADGVLRVARGGIIDYGSVIEPIVRSGTLQ